VNSMVQVARVLNQFVVIINQHKQRAKIMYYISILVAGFGGGVIRGLVGFIKHQYAFKNVKFELPYFFTMMFLSGAVGVISAAAIKELGIGLFGLDSLSPALAVVMGYAGGDLIENIYKIILKKSSLYSQSN